MKRHLPITAALLRRTRLTSTWKHEGFPAQENHPCFISTRAALTTLLPHCGSPDGSCPHQKNHHLNQQTKPHQSFGEPRDPLERGLSAR